MRLEPTEPVTLRDAQPDHQRQGGDLRGLESRDYLDLGTCVNRYGPPPGVSDALRSMDIRQLLAHPYDAEGMFISTYADFLNVDASHLVAGRGITEFIRALAYVLPSDRTAVITPDYTDTIHWFPRHEGPSPDSCDTGEDRLNRVDRAMAKYPYVIFSNPNNPTGIYVDSDKVTEVCRRRPESVLIIDEAYIDFVTVDGSRSMVNCGLPNVVVLRSPNKPFGIAGVRAGALWSLDDCIRSRIAKWKLKWPLSHLDVVAAVAALRSTTWLQETRRMLHTDTLLLEETLTERFAKVVVGTPVHYRFINLTNPGIAHRRLMDQGIVTRVFTAGPPGRIPGLRITTPRNNEMPRLLEVLNQHI